MYSVYWLLNSVLGLYIIHEYGGYLADQFQDVSDCIFVFSLKWFSAAFLALALMLLIQIGSTQNCFTADLRDIRDSMKAMALPLYLICLLLL